jgi:hypothetical protein
VDEFDAVVEGHVEHSGIQNQAHRQGSRQAEDAPAE